MSKGFASSYRIVLLATGLFGCFAALGARLVWLQVTDRDELLRSVEKARRQVTIEQSRRGDILDTRGNILATSRSLMVLGIDPSVLRKEDEAKWPRLAALIGMPLPELREILTTKFYPAAAPATPAPAASSEQPPVGLVINFKLGADSSSPVPVAKTTAGPGGKPASGSDDPELEPADAKPVPSRQYVKLRDEVTESVFAQVEKLGIIGIVGERVYRRAYPHGQLGAHVIGYVNSAEQPATGIERYADFYLRGQDGWRESERDGRRRELAQFRTREVPRADGYSVRLSLDCNVQDVVEQELVYIARQFQPEKATIIVSDPRTGFVLGMGNYPTFDLNEYGKVPKEAQASMKNIAITDILEPGSTFKIVSVAAGLEEGVITPNDRFDCTLEKVEYKGKILKLPGEAHHFDHPLTIAEVVAESSNKGAAQIGMRLGDRRIYAYARAFGFARPLGFPTVGEVAGILKDPRINKWNDLDITRIPMGHTVAATALQMHQAMSTIANDGILLRPQIVREIKDSAGEAVYSYDRAEIGRAVSVPTAQTVARMLMGVTSKEGTAPLAAIPNYEVAGKTGTTQMIINGEYSEKHHIASFVGFFPASNPQIAITVIVHDADAHTPGGLAAGANVAAPSFKRIGEKLISYFDIKAPGAAADPNAFAFQGGRP